MKRASRSLLSLGVKDDGELVRRAFAAWFRAGGPHADIPSNQSAVETHGGHWYVVLRGGRGSAGSGPLAVYRLKNDGVLRRLRRWPASFQE